MSGDDRVPLPDPLLDAAGRPIRDAAAWEKRRPEILALMLREVYGFAPPPPEFDVDSVPGAARPDGARSEDVRVTLRHGGKTFVLPFALWLPADAGARRPAPAFLFLDNRAKTPLDASRTGFDDFWPADLGLARGYAMAALRLAEADPDTDDGFCDGVHGFMDRGGRDGAAWGTLRGWAWAASRVLDALRRRPDVDGDRVAVVGHSRGGKTALLAGAADPRFAMTVSNNSGCGGMALARRAKGETIERINTVFPHWFAANFRRHNHRDANLPFDQHFLAACVAPRALYHASAAEDDWADPEGEWSALRLTEPVYRLYGLGGLGDAAFPRPGEARHGRRLGYHLRPGGHGLDRTDWTHFLDFADANLRPRPAE